MPRNQLWEQEVYGHTALHYLSSVGAPDDSLIQALVYSASYCLIIKDKQTIGLLCALMLAVPG